MPQLRSPSLPAGLLRLLLCLASGLLLACGRVDSGLPAGGDFILQTADGPLDTRTLRGQLVLLYFGYTNCPDICPTSLAAGAQVLKALTPEERSKVRLLMISVDPGRDSPSHLKEYTAFFHPEMIGATTKPEEIAALAKAYGAAYIKHPAQADGSYLVDHTTATYVIAPDGRLVAVLDLTASVETLVSTVRKWL